jgi:hypothetical protein
MSVAWVAPAIAGLLLDIFVLFYLARGPFRRFIFVFCYCLVQALSEIFGSLSYLHLGLQGIRWSTVFWVGDFASHTLIMLILLSLISESLESSPDLKRLASWGLPLVVVCVLLGSVLIYRHPGINAWMTPVSRNLSFCEEVLNFVLWTALIRKRDYDRLLLFISAGIGVQVTGEVIGHTLRTFAHVGSMAIWLPDSLVSASEIICLLTWVWAFRTAQRDRAIAASEVGRP